MENSRRICLCQDGTRNGRDDEHPTNIQLLHNAMQVNDQVSLYFPGPGNEDETGLIGGILGSAFGAGYNDICETSYAALCSVYQPGDSVSVKGFSRGAAESRTIAYWICKRGVNGHFPGVDFLGCYDTVFARLPFGSFQQGVFTDLKVHKDVRRAYHMIACSEPRVAFAVNLMEPRDGIVQEWVDAGNHADIGGGYKERGRADLTLRRMAEFSTNATGMQFQLFPDPMLIAPVHAEKWRGRMRDRKPGPDAVFYHIGA